MRILSDFLPLFSSSYSFSNFKKRTLFTSSKKWKLPNMLTLAIIGSNPLMSHKLTVCHITNFFYRITAFSDSNSDKIKLMYSYSIAFFVLLRQKNAKLIIKTWMCLKICKVIEKRSNDRTYFIHFRFQSNLTSNRK